MISPAEIVLLVSWASERCNETEISLETERRINRSDNSSLGGRTAAVLQLLNCIIRLGCASWLGGLEKTDGICIIAVCNPSINPNPVQSNPHFRLCWFVGLDATQLTGSKSIWVGFGSARFFATRYWFVMVIFVRDKICPACLEFRSLKYFSLFSVQWAKIQRAASSLGILFE